MDNDMICPGCGKVITGNDFIIEGRKGRFCWPCTKRAEDAKYTLEQNRERAIEAAAEARRADDHATGLTNGWNSLWIRGQR